MTLAQSENLLDALRECLEARKHYEESDKGLISLAEDGDADELCTSASVDVIISNLRANDRRRKAVRRAHAHGASLALAGRFAGVSNATAHRWCN